MKEKTIQEPECHRCGACCRGFALRSGNTLEVTIAKKRKLFGPEEENDARQNALLRRIMIHKPNGKGSYGQGHQNYRCQMLWYNKFSKKWECLIHDSKPDMCKNFQPGDPTLRDTTPCRKEKIAYDKANPPQIIEGPEEKVDLPLSEQHEEVHYG